MALQNFAFAKALELSANTTALASYFRSILKNNDEERRISDTIRILVSQEALPPKVFALWLQVSYKRQNHTLVKSMLDTSIIIRQAAIEAFAKQLSEANWKTIWRDVGGLNGMHGLLSELSVQHVARIVALLGKALAKHKVRTSERMNIAESILANEPLALPSHDAEVPSHRVKRDTRPLRNTYLKLLPACSFEFLCTYLECHPESVSNPSVNPKMFKLIANHVSDFQTLILQTFPNPLADWQESILEILLHISKPPSKLTKENFIWRILEILMTCDVQALSQWTRLINIKLTSTLLSRNFLRRATLDTIRHVFNVMISLLERQQTGKPHTADQSATDEPDYDMIDRAIIRLYSRERRHPNWFNEKDNFINIHVRRVRCEGDERYLHRLRATLSSDDRTATRNLRALPPSFRCQYLRVICRYPLDIGFDIESPETLAQREPRILYSVEVLLSLARSDGLNLLQKILADDPKCESLGRSNSLNTALGPSFSFSFIPEVLLLYLMRRSPTIYTDAAKYVEKWKQKAQAAKDSEDRAECARIAAECATASGEISLHLDVSRWCRRFLRDQTAWPTLYNSTNGFLSPEASNILSPTAFTHDRRPPEFWIRHTSLSNEALKLHSENVLLALDEPHLKSVNWLYWRSFSEEVISKRFGAMNVLVPQLGQDTLKKMISITVDCIIEIEQSFVKRLESCERFFYPPGFYIMQKRFEGSISSVFLPYMDQLAYRRNETWSNARFMKDKDVMSLPETFPQGLAVQHLLPFECLRSNQSRIKMPYMKDRIDRALWADEIQSKDEDTKRLVGIFEDDWQWSLKVRIEHGTRQQQENVVKELWERRCSRALSSLKDTDEKIATLLKLKHRFHGALGDRTGLRPCSTQDFEPLPHFPTFDDPSGLPTEWFPVHGLVNIDRRTKIFRKGNPYTTHYWVPNPQIGDQDRDIRDAFILSTLLYLDIRSGSKTQLLKAPYPSKECQRFPYLYLDLDFIDRVEQTGLPDTEHLKSLAYFVKSLPLDLVAHLGDRVLQNFSNAANSVQKSSCMQFGIGLTKILADGDDPRVAFPFIETILIHHPDLSSYHRQILRVGMLKRAPAKDTRDLLRRLCKKAINRLLHTDSKDNENLGPSEDMPRQARVKVTTFKLLASVVVGEYISIPESVALLMSIMRTQKHPSVLEAVLKSFINLIRQPESDAEIVEQIFAAIETLILPSSDGNEVNRGIQNTRATDDVGESQSLHSLDQIQTSRSPLATCIWSFGSALPSEYHDSFVHRILLPFIDASSKEHERWIRSFVRSYGDGAELSQELVFPPFQSSWMTKLVADWGPFVPKTYLRYFLPPHRLFTSSDSRAIESTNRNLLSEPKARDSDEGLHWMEICSFSWLNFVHLLRQPMRKVVRPGAISLADLQEVAYQQASDYRWSNQSDLSRLMANTMLPSLYAYEKELKTWTDQMRPVVVRVIALLESTWIPPDHDVATSMPQNFSLLFAWKTYLLSFPQLPHMMHRDDKYDVFTHEISELLGEITDRDLTYHEEFEIIKSRTICVPKSPRTAAMVLALGDVSPESVKSLLRIELATEILDKLVSPPPEEKIRIQLRQMVEHWAQSKVEKVWRFHQRAHMVMRRDNWFPIT